MPGAGGSESARNCREAFRCGWWDFGSYTLFKGPDAQLLPISALTETRACDAERQGPRRFAWGAAAGAVAVGLTTVLPLALGAGLGCWVLVLVPALWCWRWCWPWVLVVSRTRRKGICRACGCAAYGTRADSQTTGCVGSCDSQLVVLKFTQKLAD